MTPEQQKMVDSKLYTRQPEGEPPVRSSELVMLRGGTELTHEQCKAALDTAMLIIEKVGTTGIEHAHQEAERWMKRYYPAWV